MGLDLVSGKWSASGTGPRTPGGAPVPPKRSRGRERTRSQAGCAARSPSRTLKEEAASRRPADATRPGPGEGIPAALKKFAFK